ncbi:hypothetical protein JOD57_002401 [Geodermatophilus bullaregiensis]|uniref:hypothetical protein n=1 Tax=Geodermatophilus bullaregiensis TaxID=1564160 RepID=UPI00195D128F|nr:hypothetical protein [Geodermatophilus bullaregiensis]MBM7806564.1 hypothetical protein [Geodermatophilus bullaregiensis]
MYPSTERRVAGRRVPQRRVPERSRTERTGRHAWVRTVRRPLPELTADVAVQVAAAAVAVLPGASVEWLEVDGSGLYEAHLLSAEGQAVVVHLDADLTVVGWLAEVG